MSSGEAVLWGKASDKASPAFHIFSLIPAGWKKLREVKHLCEHERVYILPVTINSKEQLAVSCWKCQSIKLYNLDTLKVTTAFYDLKYRPGRMYHGEDGKLYVVHGEKGDTNALEVNCSEETFSGPCKIIQSGLVNYFALCYISSHKLLVFTSWSDSIVRAVSAGSGETVWQLKGEVDGKMCYPHGMLFSSKHQLLLIADGRNNRLLVLHPRDGSHVQTIHLDQEIATFELSLHQNKVIMLHRCGHQEKISYFVIH